MIERKYPHLFSPLRIKNTVFKNRILNTPNAIAQFEDGHFTDYYIGYLEAKAKGGAAQVTLGEIPVDDRSSHNKSMRVDFDSMSSVSELVSAIHQHNAVASVELNHGGDATDPNRNHGNAPISSTGFTREDGVTVLEMDEEMIEKVINGFADTAALFQRCGFDMCMIHIGHHWLVNQFMSPHWNKRTDRWGGSYENRMRFPTAIIDRVRERCGRDFLIEVRVSVDDYVPDGRSIDETIRYLKDIEDKIDLIHCSMGANWEGGIMVQSTPYQPRGALLHLAKRVKDSGVKVPVVAMGGISSPEMAEEIIASGTADFVALGRALICDPEFPNKAMHERDDDIRPCLRCMSCYSHGATHLQMRCAINPVTGREGRMWPLSHKTDTPRRILVVGGGPAGMQAAISAAEHGHDVTLAEQTDSLGGLLKFALTDSIKEDLRKFVRYLIHQVEKNKINVLYNTKVDAAFCDGFKPDVIMVASGSRPIVPRIDGIDGENVMHGCDVYTQPEKVGGTVAIIGGGLVGVEVGLHLDKLGKKVTIIEMAEDIAAEASFNYRFGIEVYMRDRDVGVLTGTKCTGITAEGVKAVDADGAEVLVKADTVVYAVGMRSNYETYEELYNSALNVVCLGDCKKVGKVDGAIHDGFNAVLDLD